MKGFPALLAFSASLAALTAAHRPQRPRIATFGPSISADFHITSTLVGYPDPFTTTSLVSNLPFAFPSLTATDRRPVPITREKAEKIVTSFLKESLGLISDDYQITDLYSSARTGVTHVHVRQKVHGLMVINAEMNLNLDSEGRLFSYGDAFYKGVKPDEPDNMFGSLRSGSEGVNAFTTSFLDQMVFMPQKTYTTPAPLLSSMEAFLALSDHIGFSIDHPSRLSVSYRTSLISSAPIATIINVPYTVNKEAPTSFIYISTGSGLELCHNFELEMEDNWLNAQVSAMDGRVLQLVDWVADASYTVFPLGYNDPRDGPRVVIKNPANNDASPLGWHSQGVKNYTVTVGNNVYAHENLDGASKWEDNYRPQGTGSLIFDAPLDLSDNPKAYLDMAITNLFYWNNIIHDLFYNYGFDEKAGNFQENNFGRGGRGGDAVIANAQDGSGFNNANFATPPDGQRARMRMYVWNTASPYRDGDLESGIIIHEYAHGISTRLTGGPANSGCLGYGEAGGMGEGWGDFFATLLRMKDGSPEEKKKAWLMGDYANNGEGIRRYPYSLDLSVNPETYAVMDKPGYWGVHAKGAVWAEMLYEVLWNLIDKHGFATSLYPNSTDTTPRGNTLLLQLVIDGMKLQPCRPSFIQARDAIIQADEVLTGGDNGCEIWKGFAKRGLGIGARIDGGSPWGGGKRKESMKVPKRCRA